MNRRIIVVNNERWTKIIDSHHKLLDLHIRDVIRYRDLVWMLVKRDFVVTYKQTILGPLWYIIQPLLSTVMYAFVFGNLAGIGTDGVPYILFYFAGNMLWTYFTNCVTKGSETFLTNQNVFSKVYFPRLCVPIADTIGLVFKLLIQFACLLAFYIYYLVIGSKITPSWYIFLFPLLLVWIGCMGMGIGLIFSALTTKYRDLKQLLTFALPLAMYATPVVYPLSESPAKFKLLFMLNPMSAPVEAFRVWFYGAGQVSMHMYAVSLTETVLLLLTGLILFSRNERNFVDVI